MTSNEKNTKPRKGRTRAFKDAAAEVQDAIHRGKPRDAIRRAAAVLEAVRAETMTRGLTRPIDDLEAAGATLEQRGTIVGLAVLSRVPPRSLLEALAQATPAARHQAVRAAICSAEAHRWVEGLVEDVFRATSPEKKLHKEYVAWAEGTSDSMECLARISRAASSCARAEFLSRLALYVFSTRFDDDLEPGSRRRTPAGVVLAKGLLASGKPLTNGFKPSDETARLCADLDARIEAALGLHAGGAWAINAPGPTGAALLREPDGSLSRMVAFGSADDSADSALLTADAINGHWSPLADDPLPVRRIFFIGAPIVLGDASRMPDEERDEAIGGEVGKGSPGLARLAAAMATLQAAAPLLPVRHQIVQRVLDGQIVAEALYFSTAQPIELGRDLFESIRLSMLAVGGYGYPPATPRGRAIWATLMRVISSWARCWPEDFPWFDDPNLQSWVDGHRLPYPDAELRELRGGAAMAIDRQLEDAIARAMEDRADEDAAFAAAEAATIDEDDD